MLHLMMLDYLSDACSGTLVLVVYTETMLNGL